MKKMYAPWRHNYVTKKEHTQKKLKNHCVFCQKFSENDDTKNLILRRFNHSVVIMNAYPYNAGHLMILPIEHHATLDKISQPARAELMEVVTASSIILENSMQCQGMNIGINSGIAGGGGIPTHLHIHVLPRWQGDTNFLATLADTNLICSDFYSIYTQLYKPFSLIELPVSNR